MWTLVLRNLIFYFDDYIRISSVIWDLYCLGNPQKYQDQCRWSCPILHHEAAEVISAKKMKQLKICKSLWIITILSGTWPWLRPIKLCMKMLESCHNRIQICQFGFVRVRAHPKIKQNVSIDAQSWGCPWWCDDTLSIIPTTEIKSF